MSEEGKEEATPTNEAKVPNARTDRRLDPKGHLKPLFLEEYAKCENQSQAAEAVGLSQDTISRWKKKDAKFMADLTAAHLAAVQKNNDGLKKTTIQLGIQGNPHYAIDKKTGAYILDARGNRVVMYREFYPNLNQFLLKNRLPEEFKDKFEYEISGQLIVTLASEFIAIVRRNAPIEVATSIEKELEMLSTKLMNT